MSTRRFNQQDRDLIISSGNATAAGIGTGVPTGTRTTTVTPVTTREPVEPTITRSTPTTSGNTSNQATIFFDQGGESDSGGGTGMNVGLGDSGIGNRNISVRNSKTLNHMGSYNDFCVPWEENEITSTVLLIMLWWNISSIWFLWWPQKRR